NPSGVDRETGETIAELATDWTLRDDGLKLDLQLQQDVTFHDGTKLTADVVVKNFDRWGNATKLLGADLLRQVGRLPYSVVFGGYSTQDACVSDSVEPASKRVATLHMAQPVNRSIPALTPPAIGITSPTSWEEFDPASDGGPPMVPLPATAPYQSGDTHAAT